ncbi:hypothetical protein EVAR_36799_1 [Eumeta japonica]|uniref:Uncharacterized protein n=1 Tax=Eumeta variegata TaxID=151549 RepID=A0A4C1WUK6_EUMVA|nr:hypothetical protein EVAR_36799_1 [Eumeta japonica]
MLFTTLRWLGQTHLSYSLTVILTANRRLAAVPSCFTFDVNQINNNKENIDSRRMMTIESWNRIKIGTKIDFDIGTETGNKVKVAISVEIRLEVIIGVVNNSSVTLNSRYTGIIPIAAITRSEISRTHSENTSERRGGPRPSQIFTHKNDAISPGTIKADYPRRVSHNNTGDKHSRIRNTSCGREQMLGRDKPVFSLRVLSESLTFGCAFAL